METVPVLQLSSPTFPLVFSIHCAVTLAMQWCHGPHWRHKRVMTSWRCCGEGCRGTNDVTVLCSSTKLLPIGWGSHFPTKAAARPWPWHARSQTMQPCQRDSQRSFLFIYIFLYSPRVNRLYQWETLNADWTLCILTEHLFVTGLNLLLFSCFACPRRRLHV
jgi:hypothetical protein